MDEHVPPYHQARILVAVVIACAIVNVGIALACWGLR